MAPITVLHLVEDMKIGGLERVLASIVLHLDKKKFQPEVWCLARGGEMAEELLSRGVKVQILNLTTYYNPLNILRLSLLMKQNHISILHTHGYYGSTFGRLSALIARVPIILTHVHSTYLITRKETWRSKRCCLILQTRSFACLGLFSPLSRRWRKSV